MPACCNPTAGILPEYERPLYMRLTEHFVYLCGTSKAICSGLRIAYLVSSSDLKERLYQSIFNINVKTSSLDAEIITQLLLNGTAARITSEKKMLAEQCNILFSQHFPSGAAKWVLNGCSATGYFHTVHYIY